MSNSKYDEATRKAAVARAKEVGPKVAGRELGIPAGSISAWTHFAKKSATHQPLSEPSPMDEPVEPVAESTPTPPPVKPAPTPGQAKSEAKIYTPSQKAATLEYAALHGVSAAAKQFGMTRFAIYDWQRKVELHARGKSEKCPVVGSDENRAALRDSKILSEWKAHPGLGPSQVRNQLRRQGFKVSLHTVRCVLEKNGYVTPRVRRTEAHDQCYEAVRPNHIWHLDFLHRHINKQKVYALLLLDDYSRFIVGGALWDGERVAAVQETFLNAVNLHGKPCIALSDGGSAFYSWKGVGQFTKLLEELEVDQSIASTPQANGKLEVLNANIQKELFNKETFFDLGEAQQRFLNWIRFYNFRRTHHGLGGLLVPADRYFGRAEEVLGCIESGRDPAGLGEPAAVAERHLDLFRVSSYRGQVELHLLGHRILLPLAAKAPA